MRMPAAIHKFSLVELKSIKSYRNEREEVVKGDIAALEEMVRQKQGFGSLYFDNAMASFYIKGLLIFD